VPDLLSRVGVAGTNSRRGEIELVEALPICDCQFPIGFFNRQLAIGNWKSKMEFKE
jgi:hypothetical protein